MFLCRWRDPPGHAQVDFGEAIGVIGGVERKIHFFVFDLPALGPAASWSATPPRRRGSLLRRSPLPGVQLLWRRSRSPSCYDNNQDRRGSYFLVGDGKQQRTRGFAELQSHYLFRDRFGRPGKGQRQGQKSRGWSVTRDGTSLFLFRGSSKSFFEALNVTILVECCRRRMADRLRGHNETIAQETGVRDLAAFQRPLPPTLRRLREGRDIRVSSLSLVRYRLNGLLGPDDVRSSRRACSAGYVHNVVISCARGSDCASSRLPTSATTSYSIRCTTWR